jgi:hypothetical protein
MKLRPGNIWSGSKQLAVFTNPTVLAKRKGNLQRDYPVTFRNKRYADAEAAYQSVKRSGPWLSLAERERLCTAIVTAKLEQYPILMEVITENGGEDWIRQCSHVVGGHSRWEGTGTRSAFIRCLLRAYKEVSQ